jgi:hypothetical protein
MTVCGVEAQAWPYACSINDYNGLKFDPVSGQLWYPPENNEYGAMVERYNDNGMLIPASSWTPINWKSPTANQSIVRRDVGSATQNWVCQTPIGYASRLTCPDDTCFAGWYECVLNVTWLTVVYSGDSIRSIGIRLNGSGSGGGGGVSGDGIFFRGRQEVTQLTGYWNQQIFVREIYLRPGDYVEAMAYHNVPSWNLAVSGSLSVRWVGAADPNTVGSSGDATTEYPPPYFRSGSCL